MTANAMHMSSSNEAYTPREIVAAERIALGGEIDIDPASCPLANTVVQAKHIYTITDDGLRKPWGPINSWGPGTASEIDDDDPAQRPSRARCNPPGGKDGNKSVTVQWWRHGVSEWVRGNVGCMTWIAFKLDFLQITQQIQGLPLPLDFVVCCPKDRLAYLTPNLPGPTAKNPDRKPSAKQIADHAATGLCTGDSPPHASAIIFLPERDDDGYVNMCSVDRFREAFRDIGAVSMDAARLESAIRHHRTWKLANAGVPASA